MPSKLKNEPGEAGKRTGMKKSTEEADGDDEDEKKSPVAKAKSTKPKVV